MAADVEPRAGVRLFLLLLLPVMAWAVHWDGQRYDPGLLSFDKAAPGAARLLPGELAGFSRLGPVRLFDRENLYEYINGHAEYFISAGFVSLSVAEYGRDGGKPLFLVDLYDMGKPLHAFGVLSEEAGGEAVSLGVMGFAKERGVSFIAGAYLVKLVAFADDAPLLAAGKALAGALAGDGGSAGFHFDFPPVGEAGATRFIKETYRGWDFAREVVEREVLVEGKGATLFLLAPQGGAVEQGFLALLAYDGTEYQVAEDGGGRVYTIHDPYEGEWFLWVTEDRVLGFLGEGARAALTASRTPAPLEDPQAPVKP